MKPPEAIRNFAALAHAAGAGNAIALMSAHIAQKVSPVLHSNLRRSVTVVRSDCCTRPVHLRMATSDKDAFRQIFIHNEYEPCSRLADIRTIVDCGANVGLASMYLLDRYPEATLLAIEPDADNAAMCRRNLAGYGDRASVEAVGIWSHGSWECPARLRLERNARDRREWAITVRDARPDESAESSGVSMSAICDRAGGQIDLLKIDIEGTEEIIFSDPSSPWLSRVRNIAIELHNDRCRDRFAEAMAGFTFNSFSSGESVFIRNLTRRACPGAPIFTPALKAERIVNA